MENFDAQFLTLTEFIEQLNRVKESITELGIDPSSVRVVNGVSKIAQYATDIRYKEVGSVCSTIGQVEIDFMDAPPKINFKLIPVPISDDTIRKALGVIDPTPSDHLFYLIDDLIMSGDCND